MSELHPTEIGSQCCDISNMGCPSSVKGCKITRELGALVEHFSREIGGD